MKCEHPIGRFLGHKMVENTIGGYHFCVRCGIDNTEKLYELKVHLAREGLIVPATEYVSMGVEYTADPEPENTPSRSPVEQHAAPDAGEAVRSDEPVNGGESEPNTPQGVSPSENTGDADPSEDDPDADGSGSAEIPNPDGLSADEVHDRFDRTLENMLDTPPEAAPDCGGAGDPESEIPPEQWVQRLKDWLEESGMSPAKAAPLIGISDQTIRNLVNGTTATPSSATQEKLREAFKDYPPLVAFEPVDEPEVIGNLPRQPSPKQAAAYLQKALAAWMRSQGLKHDAAAEELGISKRALLSILQCHLPHTNLLTQIVKRIPELKPDLPALMSARRMFDNQQNGRAAA